MAITRKNMLRRIVKMRELGRSCPMGENFDWTAGPRTGILNFSSNPPCCAVCEWLMKVDRKRVSALDVRYCGTKCYCPCNYWKDHSANTNAKINSIIRARCKEYNLSPPRTSGGC